MDSSRLGSFALVSYIPDPLGSFLDGMRRSLPGFEFAQAHITILPPRPLAVPAESASEHVVEILRGFPSFEVSFSAVRRFPASNVLYLPLDAGRTCVHEIHAELNSGELAAPEQFEFLPHLTVAGPMPAEDLDRAESEASLLWESCGHPRGFRMNEVVALLALPNGRTGVEDWICLWKFSLSSNQLQQMAATL